MVTIGNKIKKVREFKNFTQEHIAKKLNMSLTAYGNIERDETDINYSRLEQIAGAFDMRAEDLVCFDEKMVINFNSSKFQNNHNAGYIVQHVVSDEIKTLFESQIVLLNEKIKYLEEKLGKN